jgi:hypothetical protein
MKVRPAIAALPLLAGCLEEPAKVVVVLESDLAAPAEVNGLRVSVMPAPPKNQDFAVFANIGGFPQRIDFVSHDTRSFSVSVRLLLGVVIDTGAIVVDRSVTDVRFVDRQTRMLVVPLPRACACQGTSCPAPGDPACDDIASPELMPFDPARAADAAAFPPDSRGLVPVGPPLP